MKVYLESLGCARNQVDSEIMMGTLERAGHTLVDDPARAGTIIVNTCGFITTAADEAIEVILDMAGYKKKGLCRRLIVTGCLPQRYQDDKDLSAALPEVDVFLGTRAVDDIVHALDPNLDLPYILFRDPGLKPFQEPDAHRRLLYDYHAYVKVSEGCSRHCTYCIIPALRGRQRSRPADDICREARGLFSQGVREVILTAENTTDWGHDLAGRPGFETVLDRVAQHVPKTARLRLLYTHPATLSEPVMQVIASNPRICSYYDVPVQHVSDRVLRQMGRPYTGKDLFRLFDRIRLIDSDAALRTTLITGFPGETREDFDALVSFVETVRFDHLGVFVYSDSQDTVSHGLPDHVPGEVALERHDILMGLQAEISKQINAKYVGQTLEVLVEENPEGGLYLGRTGFQAPEVDGVTFIYDSGLEIGSMVKVKITDCFEYDIAGELA